MNRNNKETGDSNDGGGMFKDLIDYLRFFFGLYLLLPDTFVRAF